MRPALLPQLFALLTGLTLSGYGLYTLLAAERGIDTQHLQLGSTPVTVYKRADLAGKAPVVVISHGFAGSQQLMQSFSLGLAHSGFVAVAFDYLGHGRNLAPLTGDITRVEGATQALLAQTRNVVDMALGLPQANGELAILGHSMASDIIVRYAEQDPRVQATVAISMFSTAVTAEEPRNLLVIVGGLEGFLKDEALRVLGMVTENPAEAVTVGRFEDGTARRVAFADGVEHVGVLYSRESLSEAIRWLSRVFGTAVARGNAADEATRDDAKRAASPGLPGTIGGPGVVPASGRGTAIMSLLLGLTFLGRPFARNLPSVTASPRGAALSWRQLLLAGLAPAIVTPLLLMNFPPDFLGALVGGYLAVHFLVYGLLSALCLWWLGRGAQRVAGDSVDAGCFALATALAVCYFAGVFALVLDRFVTSYAITTTRLPLLLLTGVGTLAYFLSDEWMTHGATTARGGHLFTRCCFLLSLGLAVALSFEDLFFLLIIAAVIIIYFLLYGLFSRWIYRATGHPAVAAIANAVTFAWALAAVFPFLSP